MKKQLSTENFYGSNGVKIALSKVNISSDINLLVQLCYTQSFNAGWHHDRKTGEPIPADAEYLAAARIALIHSEVSEALEGLRKDKQDDHLPHRKNFEVELGDAVIRIFDLAGAMGLDLGGAIAEKLEYNATRPDHKHENRIQEGGKAF